MNYDDTIEEMNIELGDTSNVTFTIEEKQRAMTKAWNDSYNVKTVWNSSLTFSRGTYQYAKPSGVDAISGIYIKSDNSLDEPEQISSDLWEVVDTNIHFKKGASSYIPDGYTLYIKGRVKLDPATDTLPSSNHEEYIIALGGYNTLTLLGYKKANLFLKNDTSMSELINLRREFKQDVREYRAKLLREYENA